MPFRKHVWLRSFDDIGEHRYSFTLCTWKRRAVFADADVVTSVLVQFQRSGDLQGMAILAYCFMPDHLHLLTAGTTPMSDARRFIIKAKQATGYEHAKRTGTRLWQRYSWDHVLRSEEVTLDALKYILTNPVRAGLVSHPLEYQFSGSLVYSREQLISAFVVTGFDGRAG
jgi:putative transposase